MTFIAYHTAFDSNKTWKTKKRSKNFFFHFFGAPEDFHLPFFHFSMAYNKKCMGGTKKVKL